MNRKILTFILTSIWLLFWASPSIALVTEYQEAVDAYNREDYKAAYKLILPLAKKGFAQAQYNLGVMYEKGKGVKKNLKKAKKWFQFAAEQGVVKAQYKLGLMYGKGKGVAKDYSKAIKWWNLAADQGNGKAQINLGWMYEMGKGVPKDAQKAANWYQLASNQGLAKAQEKLNLLLNKTKEHFQENTVSSKEKSSKEIQDLRIATASLRSELNQIKSEKAKAIETTNQANAKAKQEQLASISDNLSELNTGSVSFREDAFSGARYSADTFTKVGDDINDLDRFHAAINSLGKKEIEPERRQLLLDLADKGIPEAQINLGMMFESGQGVPQDYKEAIRWYRLAADLGHIKAQEKLNLILNKTKEHSQENTASSEKFESLKEKIKKHSIFKKKSTPNLTKKSQPGKSRNNSEVITSKDLVSKHLDKWVRAWEKQDIELYLSFYSKEFKGSKERHADWRISRQAALKRHANISIQLQNIQISQSKDTVDINFTQTFKSDEYSDIGVKRTCLGKKWK